MAKRAWLPKEFKGGRCLVDGEPTMISMSRFKNDRAIRGRVFMACCDCGLQHLATFELFRDPAGDFHLVLRSYRAKMETK